MVASAGSAVISAKFARYPVATSLSIRALTRSLRSHDRFELDGNVCRRDEHDFDLRIRHDHIDVDLMPSGAKPPEIDPGHEVVGGEAGEIDLWPLHAHAHRRDLLHEDEAARVEAHRLHDQATGEGLGRLGVLLDGESDPHQRRQRQRHKKPNPEAVARKSQGRGPSKAPED